MAFSKFDFGDDFAWGVSSAAFQIEGAVNQGGKGPSIWDDFTQKKGKIRNADRAEISCDFYHKFPQDLALMRSMNIRNFRFSLSWSRIFPTGTGIVNKPGVDYYNRLIDFCLELGIEPWITLYHWDLPLELQRKGGWCNREIINWFEDYAAFCIKTFGDRVKKWMILNEPMVFTGAGYFLGIHAPGKTNVDGFFAAVHHAALCQSLGGAVLRSSRPDLEIGTTFSCSQIDPASASQADVAAASRMDALLNRLFIEPLLGKMYPVNDLRILQRIEPFIRDGDEQRLCFNMDFIGLQNYTREIVAYSWLIPYMQAKIIKADERGVDRTTMNWEVYPESIYHMLKQFSSYKNAPPIIITENGAAFPDKFSGTIVDDFQRKVFLQRYIEQVLKAKNEGISVAGYFVWSFTDNFEWAEGFEQRFGIVRIDYHTQKRTIKSSGLWYKEFLTGDTVDTANTTSVKNMEGNTSGDIFVL
ncbi:MAG: beta-glucosidase [Chitinophagaceae bacterium]|nr:MAG: beta-glucosidase [Chitinophagaceae bacterium]